CPTSVSPAATCEWSRQSYLNLHQSIESMPVGHSHTRRETALRDIKWIDPDKPLEGEAEMAKAWTELASKSNSVGDMDVIASETWYRMGCAADGAPYIIRKWLYEVKRCDLSLTCRA